MFDDVAKFGERQKTNSFWLEEIEEVSYDTKNIENGEGLKTSSFTIRFDLSEVLQRFQFQNMNATWHRIIRQVSIYFLFQLDFVVAGHGT